MFCADYGLLVSQYPEWMQGALNVLVGLFQWIGLADNIAKSKTMTFHLRSIILGMSHEAFFRSITG